MIHTYLYFVANNLGVAFSGTAPASFLSPCSAQVLERERLHAEEQEKRLLEEQKR